MAESSTSVGEVTTQVATEQMDTETAGPIESTGMRMRVKVQEYVGPKVEAPLKIAQEKYEQLKTEYPSAASTLETAEKKLSEVSGIVAKSGYELVKKGDGAIAENLTQPIEKVKTVVMEEADKEEVKNVKSSGVAFVISLYTLILSYSVRILEYADGKTKEYMPETPVELVKTTPTTEGTAASSEQRAMASGVKIINRLYSFFLKKSTLGGQSVDFSKATTWKGFVAPTVSLLVVVALGLIRFECELGEKYTGPFSDAIQKASRFILANTNFGKTKDPLEEAIHSTPAAPMSPAAEVTTSA